MKSTGGEVDNNKSHPGVAIYFKGANIGAVVSTGNWTWKVEVQGQRPLPGKWQSYTYLVICFPLIVRCWNWCNFDTKHLNVFVQDNGQILPFDGLIYVIMIRHLTLSYDPTKSL